MGYLNFYFSLINIYLRKINTIHHITSGENTDKAVLQFNWLSRIKYKKTTTDTIKLVPKEIQRCSS